MVMKRFSFEVQMYFRSDSIIRLNHHAGAYKIIASLYAVVIDYNVIDFGEIIPLHCNINFPFYLLLSTLLRRSDALQWHCR